MGRRSAGEDVKSVRDIRNVAVAHLCLLHHTSEPALALVVQRGHKFCVARIRCV
jgi:hypothetical protein